MLLRTLKHCNGWGPPGPQGLRVFAACAKPAQRVRKGPSQRAQGPSQRAQGLSQRAQSPLQHVQAYYSVRKACAGPAQGPYITCTLPPREI